MKKVLLEHYRIDETHSNEDDFERLMKMDEEWPDHFDERSRPSRGELEQAGERKLEDLGFDAGVTAAVPIVPDKGIHQEALQGIGGVELLVVFEREGREFGGVFAGDHEGSGFDAELQGIEAGSGLTSLGARTGGALRVEAVGVELCDRSHRRLQGSWRAGR